MKYKRTFLQKIRFKYRVSVLNENTLEEAWHARLSRVSVFVWTCIFFLITFALLALLIIYTPVRHYLPGYVDASIRTNLIEETARIDSLSNKLLLQQEYLMVLRGIISGELKNDSVVSLDSIALIERERISLEKSQIERDFAEEFEQMEKYNLSLLEEKSDARMYVFFKPTHGIVSSEFALDQNQYGISFSTTPNETVLSVLDGIVIYAAFTFDFQWVIMVQHNNEYLSIYKNNSRLLKSVGTSVRAGETIAIVGNTTENEPGTQFYFELWKKGTPINPADVIAL